MVQGTTSNAGKSVIAAGLCRIFSRYGLRVAPFKPQNMALNSAVTSDGGEIGRSQAVQALACGIEPHSDMNPILLKPNSDKGAQIIINGHSVGNMDALEYHAFKAKAIDYALESFRRLQSQYDLIIVEGAGSPAEINLRENDIANMGFATAVKCPVVLVADIDRGGVFAHLTGTMDCLDQTEQRLVKGFLINRFRGDKSLLDSGIDWLTDKTGIPTLAVLPYLKGLHIEAEDAVDARNSGDIASIGVTADVTTHRVQIVVPRIPRISNHTDFDVLRIHPAVDLVFVSEGESIPSSDLIILPGSKSTISDLNWLFDNGWDRHIKRHLRYGGKLIGICGGYQMIGRMIHDPDGIEGPPGSLRGLALMNFETVLKPGKQLKRVSGKFVDGGAKVEGYEIHLGITCGPDLINPAVILENPDNAVSVENADGGAFSEDRQIFCTYLHGVFDHQEARGHLIKWAGLKNNLEFDYQALREREIDRVADMLEQEVGRAALLNVIGASL